MEELRKLEHLSLVSKICTELDNHLGLNDKDLGNYHSSSVLHLTKCEFFRFLLAEFIIDLATDNSTFGDFKRVLFENGAEFNDSFITNLLRIIQLMKPSGPATFTQFSNIKADGLACKFPGLAIANKPQDEVIKKDTKEDKKNVKNVESVDDIMAELESFAPKAYGSKDVMLEEAIRKEEEKQHKEEVATEKKRERDKRSPEHWHKDRSRSREKGRNDRSRSRGDGDKKRVRSRSRDRKRHRSRSTDRKRRRSRSRRDRDRNDRDHSRNHRRRSRSRSRRNRDESRRRSPAPSKQKRTPSPMAEDPEAGAIYSGRVANIVPFGCFIQIMGLKKRWEGLVHISQLRAEGRVTDVTEVVSRGQNVKVKVMSVAGQKVSLSMKEVDQDNGKDMNPASHAHLRAENDARDRNPDRPSGGTSMLHLEGKLDGEEDNSRKRVTRISSPERWEIKQMISSGVIDRSELPDFDDETGLLPKDEDDEADIEIEIVEEEPPFLQGHGRALNDLSPVRIVKNPDGSLAQAAMMQSALAKERRELKMLQREQEMDTIPTSLNKNWIDPLPDGKF